MYRIAFLSLCFVLLSACTSSGINRTDINQFVEVIYARVVNTKAVRLDSKADEAAATGAIGGAIENADGDSDEVIGGALVGALVSALSISIEEGSRKGLLVDLVSANESNYHLILKRTDIRVGECLQLIKGDEVSIIHVDDKFCLPTTTAI